MAQGSVPEAAGGVAVLLAHTKRRVGSILLGALRVAEIVSGCMPSDPRTVKLER
jgi:hypothetical protein